jgi:hypothetical protein
MTNQAKSKNDIALESLSLLRKHKHIIKLQGKEFVTHKGLVWLAHQRGLKSVHTEMIHADFEKFLFIFKATVNGERGEYVGHGDASTKSVSKNIMPHLIRMGETRSISRALRLYCGVGITSVDEIVRTGN